MHPSSPLPDRLAGPEIWFLTHDGHNGGRIFAPLAALSRLGCAVRIFHQVAMPPALDEIPELIVPALRRQVVGIRRLPAQDCPFASIQRLLEDVRSIARSGGPSSGLIGTPHGWRARCGAIGSDRLTILSNPGVAPGLVGWLCYQASTDSLFYSTAHGQGAVRSLVALRTLHALHPSASLDDPETLSWCLEPEDSAIAAQTDRCFSVGDSIFDVATGELHGKGGRVELHVLPPAAPPVAPVDLPYLRRIWPNYDLAMEPILRVESHALLEASESRPDMIMVADLPMLPYALELKNRWGTPVVLDAHEWWTEQERTWSSGSNDGRPEAFEALERHCYPLCDQRLTVGPGLAQKMGEWCNAPFDVLRTVADLGQSAPERAEDRDRYWQERCSFDAGTRIALFIGNLTDGRNLEALVMASGKMRHDQRLVIAGDGAYRRHLESLAEKMGQPGHLCFLGARSFDECLDLLVNADLAVIPYDPNMSANPLYFALSVPAKFADYLLCRTPVLVHGGLQDCAAIVAEHGIGDVWGETEDHSFETRLIDLLAEEDSLQAMRAAYDRLPDLFGHRQLDAKLADILQSCLPHARLNQRFR